MALPALPDALWLIIMQLSDQEARPAFFATCRAARQLLLHNMDVTLRFSMPLAQEQQHVAVRSLVSTCHHANRFKLAIAAQQPAEGADRAAHENASAAMLMYSVMSHIGALMQRIQHVTVKDMMLSSLIPNWLLHPCPNLTNLQLTNCRWVDLPHPEQSLDACSSLLSLKFESAPWISNERDLAIWRHQTRSLPNLTSLEITEQGQGEYRARWLDVAVVCTQLTQLSFVSQTEYLQALHGLGALQQLRLLNLPAVTVDSHGILTLLGLQHLRRLTVAGFLPASSFADRFCHWEHLGVGRLDLVDDLLQLPLAGIKQIQGMPGPVPGGYFLFTVPTTDAQVLAATRRCLEEWSAVGGCLSWHPTVASVNICAVGPLRLGCLSILQQLLTGCLCTSLSLAADITTPWDFLDFTEDAIQGLQLLLSSLPHVHTLTVRSFRVGDPEAAARFLAGLPAHVKTVSVPGLN